MQTNNKKNVYLFQPQLGVDLGSLYSYYLPYSVGCLWSYAKQFAKINDNFFLVDLIFRKEDPDAIIKRLKDPSLCGFSCYSWNEKYCLHVAQQIKQQWPDCVIVFGGPQTTKNYLLQPYVDSVITGEGEECFYDLLCDLVSNKKIKPFYNKRRIQELNIPSPYTTGIFDQLIENNPEIRWSMVFETNRGCPYGCTFCDWGSVTQSKVKKFNLDRIQEELDWMASNPIGYVFNADANFGIFRERDLEIAKMIKHAADRSGLIDGVVLFYAKHSTEVVFQIEQILGKYGKGVTIAVQSMNENTLQAIKRKNMKINDIAHMLELSKKYNVNVYTDVILGLPEETLDSFKQGLCDIIELGMHENIFVWFTQLLPNSELSSPESMEKYGIESIHAKDYTTSFNNKDYYGIDESVNVVTATNTMTTVDLVESYMYAWMILHFHSKGYSREIANYLYSKGINYRCYYDLLFQHLQTSFLNNHLQQFKSIISAYFKTGDLIFPDADGQDVQFDKSFKKGTSSAAHSIHAASQEYLQTMQDKLHEISITVGEQLYTIPENIKYKQKNFL